MNTTGDVSASSFRPCLLAISVIAYCSSPAWAQCIAASPAECVEVRRELPGLLNTLKNLQKLLKDCTDHLGTCSPGKISDLQTAIETASNNITCDRQKLEHCTGISHPPPPPPHWMVSEFQPDIPNGGRANTIAVHPTDNNVILVASESGGLFRSADRGIHWRHVDSLPEYLTTAVAFVRADPKVVIATAREDFRATNGGGIWRSVDSGTTWKQIPSPTAPAGVLTRFAAGEISIAPDTGAIYVATAWGVGKSTNRGATWTYSKPFTGPAPQVLSVLAQPGNHVLAGAPAGVRRSADGGKTWLEAATGPGAIEDVHAFGASPFSRLQAYVVNSETELYYSEDAGNNWKKIGSAPKGGGGCGGIAFARPIGRLLPAPFFDLYFGNRCGLWKLTPTPIAGTDRYNYGGAWTALGSDHGDIRDLAFDGAGRPLLLGTDGGLHHTADGGLNWTFVGGGPAGYNAMQITEIKGQRIESGPAYHLYFGTQDNLIWASGDEGKTWSGHASADDGGDSFYVQLEHKVAALDDIQITFCCGNSKAKDVLSDITTWPDPPHPPDKGTGNPQIIEKNFHVQSVLNDFDSLKKGLAVTRDLGSHWNQYAVFDETPTDLGTATHNTLTGERVLYLPIRTGADPKGREIDHLLRLEKDGTLKIYPAMKNFGGFGVKPTEFAWYQVLGVDPGDSAHIIAPDIFQERMMETWDGGDNWTEIPKLTSLVTDSGRFRFRSWILPHPYLIPPDTSWWPVPHASAVSFCPDDPAMVVVGTMQGGILASADRGRSWSKIPGSEPITYITGFEWRTPREIIVSTYGRGLWSLSLTEETMTTVTSNRLTTVGAALKGLGRSGPVPGGQQAKQPAPREESPITGKPYVEIGSRTIAPGETLNVHGRNFNSGSIVITIDSDVVQQVSIGQDRVFEIKIPSPRHFGLHRLTILDAKTRNVIDGLQFLVRHADRSKDQSVGTQPRR